MMAAEPRPVRLEIRARASSATAAKSEPAAKARAVQAYGTVLTSGNTVQVNSMRPQLNRARIRAGMLTTAAG